MTNYGKILFNQLEYHRNKSVTVMAKEVQKLYIDAAKELMKVYRQSKSGGFNKAWALRYMNHIQQHIKKLTKQLDDLGIQSINEASKITTDISKETFENATKVNLPQEVIDRMFGVPEEVINRLINGTLYKGGVGLSKRVWNTTNKYKQDINYVIAQGLAANKSYKELAQDLEKYINPQSKKDWNWNKLYPKTNKQVDYNAVRLIRTSINHSFYLSNVANVNNNPFATGMHWQLSTQHETRQIIPFGPDECDDFAHQNGYQLGEGNFPTDRVPVPHPNCLCVQYAVIPQDMVSIGKQINSWLKGGKDSRLDDWWANGAQ